jgi:hypothetical protein
MSGLSHTPGKRAWGKTHRGFESRLLRQKMKPHIVLQCGVFVWAFCLSYFGICTIFMAEPMRLATSVMLLGTIKVVVASDATCA